MSGISSLAEIMVVLRYVELQSQLYRLVSLFKVREGVFDPTIREFEITAAGIAIGKPFEGVETVLSGMARAAALKSTAVAPSKDNAGALPDNDTGQSG